MGQCPECGLVYERNPGDTWGWVIIGDRIPVAAGIVEEARRRQVEVIVMGGEPPSRVRGGPVLGGRGGSRPPEVGEVTEYVLNKAPCRVLLTAPPELWAAILYLALLGSVVALLAWSRSVRDLGAARAGQFTYLVPLWSLLLAALVLGERPAPLQLVGAALVLAGIWLTNRAARPAGRAGG